MHLEKNMTLCCIVSMHIVIDREIPSLSAYINACIHDLQVAPDPPFSCTLQTFIPYHMLWDHTMHCTCKFEAFECG